MLNSTDNMYISAMVNTKSVGIYSNYTLIITFVNQFINVIYDALYSSVGNLNVSGTKKERKKIFDVLVLGCSWIGVFCFVCLFELMNSFLYIFFGAESLFSGILVMVICINFYLPIILYPIWMYRNTTGLFQETKNILIYTAGINAVLSYFLGIEFGILGILSATSISRLITSFWFEPYVLYKRGFEQSSSEYFLEQIKYALCICISIVVIGFISSQIHIGIIVDFVFKCFLCILVPNICLVLVSFKREAFRYLLTMLLREKQIFNRRIKNEKMES